MRTLSVLLLLACNLPCQVQQQPQQTQPSQSATSVSQVASDYRPYLIMLGAPPPDRGLSLLIVTKDQRLVFTPIDAAKTEFERGGLAVRYGDVLQLLQQLADENARLKTENERLWKIAENKSAPPNVVVQSPQPDPNAQRRAILQMMLMQSLSNQPKPYVIPQPQQPRQPVNCVTRYIGTTAYTDCN